MQIKVFLFATLKDAVGAKTVTLHIDHPAPTVANVRAALGENFPASARHLGTAIAARNGEFAFGEERVVSGDEIAFFPPVSGGSGDKKVGGENDGLIFPEIARLADTPFSTDDLIAAITVPATGAVCVFSGMVRGETRAEKAHVPDDRSDVRAIVQTEYLEYEAYESMALAKMRQVIAEIRARFPDVQGVAIVQRTGRLMVGENTIVIACASGHRDQGCFEAARYGIDRLKAIVPVWKREVRPDGAAWIEGDYLPTPNDQADT